MVLFSIGLPAQPAERDLDASAVRIARRDFVRTLLVPGTIEPVESFAASAPRVPGLRSSLVITRLASQGTAVRAGDLLVEFDRQEQLAAVREHTDALQDV